MGLQAGLEIAVHTSAAANIAEVMLITVYQNTIAYVSGSSSASDCPSQFLEHLLCQDLMNMC